MSDLLTCFPVVIENPLGWGEMDAHNHINNIWYFRYIENARIAYYEQIDKFEFEQQTGISFVLASTSCDFKSALAYPDTVIIGASVERIDKDRAVMKYRLVSKKHQCICAEAQATLVCFCYQENKKISFPEQLKERISRLEQRSF